MVSKSELPKIFPHFVPMEMSGTKISVSVRLKTDYVRTDGTSSLYIRLYESGKSAKKLPLDISISKNDF